MLYIEGDLGAATGGGVRLSFAHAAHKPEYSTLEEALRPFEIDVGELIAAGNRWRLAKDKVQKPEKVIQVRVAARAAGTSSLRLQIRDFH